MTRNGTDGPSYEGLYFEARQTPTVQFVRTYGAHRGVGMGYQWSADPCHYPYSHSEPLGEGSPR